MLGLHTITQGHRVALWDKSGRRTIVDGPRRLRLMGRRVEALKSLIAGPKQYLVIQHQDGRVEHQRGPSVFWIDPVEHRNAIVADAITLDGNEALVVYRQQPGGGKVERRIVRGPELFVPDSQEWLHEFRWHGADPGNPRRKIPSALRFSKLRVIPDQMYFDVENVRTADDALIVVKLMIFYELMDLPLMLDQTHDVTADFINAVTADVIDFAATLTFEQFKERTEKLNARETYPQLAKRAGRIGYRINKVVYRGYEATPKLQGMHDNAIEMRTKLKLEAETEAQAQELADLKLAREQERARRRQEMEQAEAEHQHRVKRVAHEEQLRQHQAEHEAQLRQQQALSEAQLTQRKAADEQALLAEQQRGELKRQQQQAAYEQRAAFLKSVQGLQVDMTRYLVARHERPDRHIRLDSGDNDRGDINGERGIPKVRPRALLHLHEGGG
jgi:hypothetical protein